MNRHATWAVVLLSACAAQAQVTFSFTAGPGLISLSGSDPVKAAGIMAGVSSAATKWGGLFADPVTLKYTIDYDPALPALGAAFNVYSPTPYAGPTGIKSALVADATSTFDATATMSLQAGPSLTLWSNDLTAAPTYAPVLDTDGSVNNSIIDISRAQLKGLGLLPGSDGGPGADGTIKFGSASFDFDPTNGIDADKYDFVGVTMHEMAHGMGFISGVDTVTTLLPPFPFGPTGPIHATPMVTVLDLFRYSSDSKAAGLFVPDVSLPVPGMSPTRYFSIDGGVSPIELFSTGIGLAGDGKQGGHWKLDASFGLMDPSVGLGVALTSAFDTLVLGPGMPADLIAMDVIGWTVVPEPGTASLVLLAGMTLFGYRRRRA